MEEVLVQEVEKELVQEVEKVLDVKIKCALKFTLLSAELMEKPTAMDARLVEFKFPVRESVPAMVAVVLLEVHLPQLPNQSQVMVSLR